MDNLKKAVDKGAIGTLSAREEQVLSYAAAGYLDKQISQTLGVSLNTLRTYWQRIRGKLGDAPRAALAVAYVEQVASASETSEATQQPFDWEIDLDRDVIKRTSSRPSRFDVPVGGEMPMDEIYTMFHPEDAPKVRALVTRVRRGDISTFTYVARIFTETGLDNASAFVQVLKDDEGRPIKALGRRAEIMDLRSPPIGRVEIGYWQRDIATGQFTADSGFMKIFRIEPGPDLRERAMARFHPEEVARCRRFVDDAIAQRRTRARATHRLVFDDGEIQWVTTDLRIVYQNDKAIRALGTVMSFD